MATITTKNDAQAWFAREHERNDAMAFAYLPGNIRWRRSPITWSALHDRESVGEGV